VARRANSSLFLKQNTALPGNEGVDMRTISARARFNAAFKKAQPLPLLTDVFVIGQGVAVPYVPAAVWPRIRASQSESTPAVRREAKRAQDCASGVWLRMERDTVGEQIALGLLTLSGMGCIAQAFGTMAELSPNWELFKALAARLVG
jgi:hypothetical protein